MAASSISRQPWKPGSRGISHRPISGPRRWVGGSAAAGARGLARRDQYLAGKLMLGAPIEQAIDADGPHLDIVVVDVSSTQPEEHG
jgi:hypothetical protein